MVRVGTRGSRLALVQASEVARLLAREDPGIEVEIVEIHTSGDRIRDVPLGPHLGQSFFTKEIEEALLSRRVDVAVHSCKDLATTLPQGLALGAIPVREDPRDVLVSRGPGLAELPPGATVGTSSSRRRSFLAAAVPHVELRELRGNVPTRVGRVDAGDLDAILLAAAGLRRLGMEDCITEYLEPNVVLPAAAQGALALQVRKDDARTLRLVSALDHPPSRAEVTAERACLRSLEAGCQAPVGALARYQEGGLRLEVGAALPAGVARVIVEGQAEDAEEVGASAAQDLLKRLSLESLRDAPWAGPPPARGS